MYTAYYITIGDFNWFQKHLLHHWAPSCLMLINFKSNIAVRSLTLAQPYGVNYWTEITYSLRDAAALQQRGDWTCHLTDIVKCMYYLLYHSIARSS